ncbi:uncharacterized protein K02A2.6-like [Rhipicephalus sanguineus]|uniref:uncharacterized protein K02A2.6-like n=1 Tax=Rhipicephalus sanguineus TaxID=34632 RepID=UPI0018956FBD|nr:uncharacterized protein K02A2.6-like [Rhipicephalus sanguineus]
MLPLDVMLRDRFVCGLRNEQVQQRLFAEKDLTFKRAFDIALRAENAVDNQKNVKTEFKEIHEACTSIGKTENQRHSSASAQKKKQHCWRCDAQHSPDTCKFQTASCDYCKKRGHIEKACLKKRKEARTNNNIEFPRQGTSTVASAPVTTPKDSPDVALYELNTLIDVSSMQKVMTQLRIHGKTLEFEVDSGAACTLISEATFKATWTDDPPQLQMDNILLRTWSGQSLRVLGCATVDVAHKNKNFTLPLVVIKGASCNLLGRNWFPHLGIQITGINDVSDDKLVSKLLDKYQSVFDEDISGHVGPAVQLELVEGAKPKSLKARPVPFALRFLKNRATITSCLYQLLQKDATWRRETKHQEAFDKLKRLLLSQTVLAHYDEQKELLVSCDASPYGIGAVLSQRDDQNREAPIAFASRTLGTAERNYAQLDREGLAVVFAAHKFHKYIAGRKVTFVTDHQPLLGILGPGKPTAQVLSPRMTRWCIKLSAYDYNIVYRHGKNHQNADALSRLPLPERLDEPWPPGDVLLFEALSRPPFTATEIARLTQEDSILQRLYKAVQDGTVKKLTGDEFTPYRRRATALAFHRECLTLGSRVIIPSAARSHVLALLHAGHRGMLAMKKCARSYVWWPGIDKVIEEAVRQCRECLSTQKSPPKAPIPSWDRPKTPWHPVHVDFAGPLLGRTYLVVVDAHTKWVEVRHVTQATSAVVIDVLRSTFATFGIPRKVVSDNGKAFISNEIRQFYTTSHHQAQHQAIRQERFDAQGPVTEEAAGRDPDDQGRMQWSVVVHSLGGGEGVKAYLGATENGRRLSSQQAHWRRERQECDSAACDADVPRSGLSPRPGSSEASRDAATAHSHHRRSWRKPPSKQAARRQSPVGHVGS